MMWRLDEAVALVRRLAGKLPEVGYYPGLTGSVLFEGQSNNDLDVILYPTTKGEQPADLLKITLTGMGFNFRHGVEVVHAKWRKKRSKDTKHVEVWEFNGKKVDFFFLS